MQASTTAPTSSAMVRPRTIRLVALAAAAAIGLAGCGGDSAETSDGEVGVNSADGGGDGADVGAEELAAEAATEAATGAEGGAGGGRGDDETPDAAANRQLIYRATIGLSSDDPDDTVERVEAATAASGGFVAGTQLRRDDLDLLRGSITIRVPAGNLDQLLADVAATAEVISRDQSVEDVTGQVADIESRLRNLRALEEELLVLLTEAREGGDTDDVLQVFDRVGQVREEIEVLEGRRDDLGDQVALSTLTVQVEPSRALVESRATEPDDDLPLPWSPGNVAASAWDATVASLQAFVDTAIRVVVFMVPVLLVWLLPVWLALGVFVWWRRRHRTGKATGGIADHPVPPSGRSGPNAPSHAEPSETADTHQGGDNDTDSEPPAAPRIGAGSGTDRA